MNRLKKLVSEILDIEINSINHATSKNNTEEWDSFNHILLISEVENVFGINISIEDSENIDSYCDLERVLRKYINR